MRQNKKTIFLSKKKKDTFNAKLSFFLSLGFWIPLFNVGLCIVSMIIASKVIRLHFQDPEESSGIIYAVIALVLSITSLVLTFVGLSVYLFSGAICTSQFCS